MSNVVYSSRDLFLFDERSDCLIVFFFGRRLLFLERRLCYMSSLFLERHLYYTSTSFLERRICHTSSLVPRASSWYMSFQFFLSVVFFLQFASVFLSVDFVTCHLLFVERRLCYTSYLFLARRLCTRHLCFSSVVFVTRRLCFQASSLIDVVFALSVDSFFLSNVVVLVVLSSFTLVECNLCSFFLELRLCFERRPCYTSAVVLGRRLC